MVRGGATPLVASPALKCSGGLVSVRSTSLGVVKGSVGPQLCSTPIILLQDKIKPLPGLVYILNSGLQLASRVQSGFSINMPLHSNPK